VRIPLIEDLTLEPIPPQSVETIRRKLRQLGVDVDARESEGNLELNDWYTATLGKKSSEKLKADSLKVADLSIHWSRSEMGDLARFFLRLETQSCL